MKRSNQPGIITGATSSEGKVEEASPRLATDWFAAHEQPALRDFATVFAAYDEGTVPSERRDNARFRPEGIREALAGRFESYERVLAAQAGQFAESSVSLRQWYDAATALRSELAPPLLAAYAQEPARFVAALGAMNRFIDRTLATVSHHYLETRQRLVREATERAEQALLQSRLRFERLFESGLLGVIVCTLTGDIKEANDSFLAMVGYSRDEVLSGKVRWAEMTPPEWGHLDDVAVEQLKVDGVTKAWEKEYLRKDGTRVPILVGVAMLDQQECIAFVLDITERKRLEEFRAKTIELEMQNQRIQESNRLKSEFLANMSHELRTPLNSIIGFANILFDGEVAPGSGQHREFLGDILKSGRHLLGLINDVLDLAKVEAGKVEFRPEPVEISRIAGDVAGGLRPAFIEKRLALSIDVSAEVDHVTLDPSRLRQVLYNYVSNALKFTPEGGQVILRARPHGRDSFRLEVEDTGIGIAPADLSRLFVEFQQLDAGASKRHSGTGLGLALTKRIVEAQGGTVGVRSEPGRGSVFFAVLPRVGQSNDQLVAEREVTSVPREGAAAVLVVDDDQRDRALLLQTLAKAGYAVETAPSGVEAIARCCKQRFDAITLDLLLPDMTGLEVLHRLRHEGCNQQTPIVVVSVVAEKGIVRGFSVHDYLHKPIDGAELLASLERARVPSSGPKGEILVVDDDPGALKLMKAALAPIGYGSVCERDPEQALAHAAQHPPLAVVLDLLMPGIDGFEFLRRFRDSDSTQRTPVIIWTMKDLSNREHSRLRELAQAVFAKGDTKPSSLVAELRRLLPERK